MSKRWKRTNDQGQDVQSTWQPSVTHKQERDIGQFSEKTGARNPNSSTKHKRLKNNTHRPGFQNKNKSSFQKAMTGFKEKQQRKAEMKLEKVRQKQEKLSALEQYKKRKQMRSAILGKKTKKGQPVMKDRMDLLLQRIQRTIASDTKA